MKRLLILLALLFTLFVVSVHFTPQADDSGDRLGVNWNSDVGGGSGSGGSGSGSGGRP